MRFLFLLICLFAFNAQSAELKYYYEMVDRQSLPADVQDYLSRQSDCQTISEQDLPHDADQKKALRNLKCETLECDRKKLYEKYEGTPMKEVIANYNSSLWKMEFPSGYSAGACDTSPKNDK